MMAFTNNTPAPLKEAWQTINRLTARERILLAKLLLDSVVAAEVNDEMDWQQLSLTAFEADWDNPDDAIYDNWRELYNVPAR